METSRIERLEKKLGVPREKAEQLAEYWARMLEVNEHTNLTAITEEKEVLEKHFLDSTYGVPYLKRGLVADIGSGGGVPGLVLAILKPNLKFTLVEATTKKAAFLKDTVAAMGLSNVEVVNERIEVYARGQGREKFDYVTARGLAPLNTLLEYAAPLLKVGGRLIAYKGKNADAERWSAENAAKTLFMSVAHWRGYFIGDGDRKIFAYQKDKETPKTYPRPYKNMKVSPL